VKRLELRLFGSFEATLDGERLPGFRSDKVRALLAYLALEGGRAHRRRSLATLLWGEQADRSANASLRVALHNLRQVLKPILDTADGDPTGLPLLTVTRHSVAFHAQHPACWVDVLVFDAQVAAQQAHVHCSPDYCAACVERMVQMVDLYRGDLLAGFALSGSPGFEEWQILQQESRYQRVSAALSRLKEHYSEGARYAQVERVARRQIELAPWDEEGHRTLMWALAMDGQRNAALAHYETCRRLIRQHMDAEPIQATLDLYRQIQNGALGWETEAGVAAEPENPYKGLQPFEEADADHFFGREALVDRLLARLREGERERGGAGTVAGPGAWANRFLAVVGPSGSGKSSVVRAGLIPALRRAGMLGGTRWIIATMVPGQDPEAKLAAELVAALNAALPADQRPETKQRADAIPWSQLVEERLPPGTRLLLFIDQAEELFTLVREQATRARFADGLLAALQTLSDRLWIVVTLRADYYDRPLRFLDWGELFHRRHEITPPLTPEELERAITGPATRVGVNLEAGLVTRLVADVGGEPGSLPLLQYALTALFERREGRAMTLAVYQAMGGLAGALVGQAEASFSSLSPGEKLAARQLFLRLIVSAETGQLQPADARRRVPQSELVHLGDEPHVIETVLGSFGRHRLLTFDRDPATGQPTVELAHEVLLEAWPRLRRWLEESRDEMRLLQRLATAAAEWARAERDAGFLALGRRLEQFEMLLVGSAPALTEVESAYLQASQAARDERQAKERARQEREAAVERESRRRLQEMLVYAQEQERFARREAAVASSLSLATSAQLALSEGNSDLALALAKEANQLSDPPPQAQRILAQAAYAPGARRVYVGHDAAVEDLALGPEEAGTALSASADGSLILWDLATGEALRRLTGHRGAVNGAVFLPGADRALSASSDKSLILWDLTTGGVLERLCGHSAAVRDVALVPARSGAAGCAAASCAAASRAALSASDDGTLILWNVESGEALRRFHGHEGAVNAVAISPDGRRALSASADHSLILWDLVTGQPIHRLHGQAKIAVDPEVAMPTRRGHEGPVLDVAFGPDGRTAYSVSFDRQIVHWDLQAGRPLRTVPLDVGICSLDVSPDGRYALLGMFDGRVILWIAYYAQTVFALQGDAGVVQAVVLMPNGRQALSGTADGSLCLWDLRSSAELRSLIYDGSAIDVALSPDGKRMLLASAGGDLSLLDYDTGVEIRRLVGHTETPFAGVFFCPPGGDRALSGAGDVFGVADDNTLRLWDVETGREICRFEGHTDLLWDIDVSSTGHWAVSGSHDGTARLWEIPTGPCAGPAKGKVLADVRPQTVCGVAISPDEKTILFGLGTGTSSEPDYSLRLVDRESGVVLRRFSGHTDAVMAITFGSDGRTALSGGRDKLVILWDVESGRELGRLIGHTGQVNQVRFCPTNPRFALSAGSDNQIILWDIQTGTALRHYVGHAGGVFGIAFAPEGRSFLSVALDDTVREWRVDATQEELLAWVQANRQPAELSPQQRLHYRLEPLPEPGRD
jgi:WD40 repeat protein/DNA-binding SARP family transcriptional activator